ncbi:restriction endonuclease subunit S [Acinetobacter sp. YH16053]|uniref:restriction endonuclease subunit S n=1 Tax=Acinetobacter sp. YH16053 TaxID=2601192 RepID=UPI0015D24296|nr:restriction endonuclease subunit S [Acinetobacter sp. YH16053]
MASPQLRFKEFNSPLIQDKLVNVTAWSSGGTPSKDNEAYWDGDIPLISGASMHTNKLYESDVKITKLGLQKGSKLAPKDSILILVRGSMLFNKIPMGITLGDVAFNQDVKCIQPKENLTSDFLFQSLSAKENVIQNKVTSTGIGAGKLDTPDLQNLVISLPSKEEQTKIASFLSKVDEKISQLTQKHELLSQYKQGMMQKLFSQQIRFKADDGSEFGEWEETTLGQTGKFIGGGTPSKENNEFWQGSIPWISSSDLVEESIFKINISRFISENALNQSATKLVPANSILIVSRVGVGKVAITPHEICTSQDFTSLALTDGNSIFFAYLIKSLTPYLLEMNQGTSIKGFVKEDLSNLEIQVPCQEEQTKIANFLSAIDQKIEVVTQQIEQAKQWKKGLLQQMFV